MNAYLGKYTYLFLSILELPAYLGSTYVASMNPPIESEDDFSTLKVLAVP